LSQKRRWIVSRVAVAAALATVAGASVAKGSTPEPTQNPLDEIAARLDCGDGLIVVGDSLYARTGGRAEDAASSAQTFLQREAPHLLPGLTQAQPGVGGDTAVWVTRGGRAVARLALDRDRNGWKVDGIVACSADMER
jgi:hypothetical protein